MADWTPPPNPSEPPQGGYPPPSETYDPFAGAPQYEDQTSLGATPLVQPGQPTPPPFPQQPQFQPPFQQSPFPQPGYPPFGQQPYGQQPPPPASNAGKVLAIGLALVVVIGGLIGVGFVLTSGDKKDPPKQPVAITSAPVTTPSPSSAAPDPVPSSSDPVPDPSSEAVAVPGDLLGATVKTFWRERFIRVGTATGACPAVSPPALDRLLKEHPCAGPYRGATYTDAKKSVVVVIVVMPMPAKADADALKNSKQVYPLLIPPKAGSGLPSLKGKSISIWGKTVVTGSYVLYGMSYRPDGKAAPAGGAVATAAGHLATELGNVLVLRN